MIISRKTSFQRSARSPRLSGEHMHAANEHAAMRTGHPAPYPPKKEWRASLQGMNPRKGIRRPVRTISSLHNVNSDRRPPASQLGTQTRSSFALFLLGPSNHSPRRPSGRRAVSAPRPEPAQRAYGVRTKPTQHSDQREEWWSLSGSNR